MRCSTPSRCAASLDGKPLEEYKPVLAPGVADDPLEACAEGAAVDGAAAAAAQQAAAAGVTQSAVDSRVPAVKSALTSAVIRARSCDRALCLYGDMILAPRLSYTLPLPGRTPLELGERTLVMGILNVTPDSFADGGLYVDVDRAVAHAGRDGRAGGRTSSTSAESRRGRVRRRCPRTKSSPAFCPSSSGWPPAGWLCRSPSTPTKPLSRARRSQRGATIVNDVSGLAIRRPPGAAVAAETGAALILMHNRGRSREMYREAAYEDVMGEVVRGAGGGDAAGNRRRSSSRVDRPGSGPRLRQARGAHLHRPGGASSGSWGWIARSSRDPPASRSCEPHWASTRPTSGTGARRPPSPRASSRAPTSSVSTTCPPCATSRASPTESEQARSRLPAISSQLAALSSS